jgi:hypothetical protein
MSGIAEELHKIFLTEVKDYDPRHYEVYIQWLADRIESLNDELTDALAFIGVVERQTGTGPK